MILYLRDIWGAPDRSTWLKVPLVLPVSMVKQRTREQQNSINSIESSAHVKNLGAWYTNEFSLIIFLVFVS